MALALRLFVALTSTYGWDEDRDWIPIAQSISLQAGEVNLPVRGGIHPALPAYFIRAGAEVAGANPLGYRLFGLVAGALTVWLMGALGSRLAGPLAGLGAAALLAFNEYHIAISAMATERIYYLAFALAALAAFVAFLREERPRDLYLTLGAAGLASLCKETTAFLLAAGLVAFCVTKPAWLRRREPYLAALLFLAIISPALVWELRPQQTGVEAGLGEHLGRIAGLGLTYHPLVFFGREAIEWGLGLLGRPFYDSASEYPTMNALMGLLLLAGTTATALRLFRRRDPTQLFLALVFVLPFAFFTFVQTRGTDTVGYDVAWNWSDLVLWPAILLTATVFVELTRRAAWVALVAAVGAAGIGVMRVQTHEVGSRRAALGACPDRIWPADGRYVPVKTRLIECMTCDYGIEAAILDDVYTLRDGEPQSLIGTDLVRGADVGTTDRDFELRTVQPGENPLFYHITYRLPATPDAGGRRMSTVVIVSEDHTYRPRFWTCDGPYE